MFPINIAILGYPVFWTTHWPINGGFLNLGLKQDTEFKQIFKGDKYGEGFWWFKQGGMNFWMWPTKHGDCDSI